MGLPEQTVTVTPEQITELNQRFSDLRHAINNHLTTVVAAAEIFSNLPGQGGRMAALLKENPRRLSGELGVFSSALERILGITPDP